MLLHARRLVVTTAVLASVLVPTAALADPNYPPPSSGSASVTPSRIRAGECATFRGDGFRPRAAIVVRDNGAQAPSTVTSADGSFATRMCFGVDATPGKHVLTGTGDAASTSAAVSRQAGRSALRSAAAAQRTVTATLYISGLQQSTPASAADSGSSAVESGTEAGLPFTGLEAIGLAAGGLLLLASGSVVMVVSERRHRRTRRVA